MKEYIIKKEFMYEDGNTYSFTSKIKNEEEDDTDRRSYGTNLKRKVDVVYIDIFKVITKTVNLYFFKHKFKKHIIMFKDVRVQGYVNTTILPTELTRNIKRVIDSKLSDFIKQTKEKNKFNDLFEIINGKFGDEVGNIPQEYKRSKNINEILE